MSLLGDVRSARASLTYVTRMRACISRPCVCVWVRQKESEDDLYEGFNNPAFKPQVQYNNFENAASAPGQLGSVLGKPGAPGRLEQQNPACQIFCWTLKE